MYGNKGEIRKQKIRNEKKRSLKGSVFNLIVIYCVTVRVMSLFLTKYRLLHLKRIHLIKTRQII